VTRQLVLAWAALAGLAADWPQFRGPGGTATSDETGLPVRWTATENVRWKAELPGHGLSSPVVVGGRVYVTACSGYQQTRLHVLCYEAATGRKRWERQLAATGNTFCNPTTNMAAPTPVADGDQVFALFATGDLACFDRDGDLHWYRALTRDYPGITNQVGLAASPVLWRDVLLLPMDNVGDSFLAGLDRATGVNRWRVERPKELNWATPLVRTAGDRPEAVFMTEKELLALDPATGARRWAYRGAGLAAAPSPIAADGLIVLPGGVAVRPGGPGREAEVAWESSRLRTGLNSFLHYRGRVYAVNPAGVLHCADAATGKALWSLRLRGTCSASPVAADGKVYATNEEGVTSVVAVGDQEGKLLATNPLGEGVQATPAVADGAIFLRSDRHLYCIAEKRPDAEPTRPGR
jgi:outer membrane protein assembly factor BamB